jgi:Tfp pilus assembly protein PilX
MSAFSRDRGAVLIVVLILAVIVVIFCVVSLLVSGKESQGTNAAVLRDKALFVASSGLEDQLKSLNDMMKEASLKEPFKGYESLAGTTPIQRRPLVSDSMTVGEYTVKVDCVTTVDQWNRDVMMTSTGWVPSASDPRAVSRAVTAIVRLGLGRSRVFDFVYFVNNWGWNYGANIIANGNVRSNGQFDFGGYGSTINALPRFDSAGSDGSLSGPIDAGGIYSGWNIVNASSLKGTAADPSYQHSFDEPVPMPNLTDMTVYEGMAKANRSWVKIDGKVVCGPVVGDKPGEPANLYLEGLNKNRPIELNGPVVVRGDLIIQGYIKGKGSIYVQGNIYVAGNIFYTSPIGPTPVSGGQSAMENWIRSNQSADQLGLFTRKHIVAGDMTAPLWQQDVSRWVYDKRNNSDEDAGTDGIPNTRAGRDGIPGTADDDVLDGDGRFTIERYTDADAKAGIIPDGFRAGDAIPGTGEDLDGDGKYTPAVRMSDFNLTVPLAKANWAGNFPPGANLKYQNISNGKDHNFYQLDGAFYTNRSFALQSLAYGKDLVINGSLVCRNSDIIFANKNVVFNYDPRLMQDGPVGLNTPKVWQPLKMVMWRSN